MKFIEELLKRKEFMNHLFNYREEYKGSDYEDLMPEFSDWDDEGEDGKTKFIAQNSNWVFIDDEGNLYGTLDKFVVSLNSEATYYCHGSGFHNLPLYYMKKLERQEGTIKYVRLNHPNNLDVSKNIQARREMALISTKELLLTKYNIDLDNLFEEYKEFCKSFGLELGMEDKNEEFERFLEDKIVN